MGRGPRTRRRFVKRAAAGLLGVEGLRRDAPTETRRELTVESDGGGVAVYEFTVSGSLSKTENSRTDTVDGTRGYGWVGPERGTDTFEYTGELTALSLNGPASIARDGEDIADDDYPPLPDAVTADDIPGGPGSDVLEIRSDGGGVAAYEFTADDWVGKLTSSEEERVAGTSAYGHVGPKRGADAYEFSTEMVEFSVTGPASVYLNNGKITPSE
ncbi:hypothetical protein M0R89_18515 (plasmid) [Halorussus limi]|uniref:Uncharacterized protein n=1 Tax=Halorussus limi TaxID=2938695 RepID=A0A8U0I019_9EURY|nr:hypothetical protein [Halorussus limi]UPV76527.1 hypothetical protein M0R89_18515 [Halorussus limi]